MATARASATQSLQVKRGWVRVLVLTLLSFGLYSLYWFYVTRRDVFREQGNASSSAFLHTLGLFVPILQFVVFYWLAKDIDQLAEQAGAPRQGVPLQVVLWIFVSVAGLVITQVAWNEYWDKKTNGKAVDVPLRFAELVPLLLAILGGLLFTVLFVALIAVGVGNQSHLDDAQSHLDKAVSALNVATANPGTPNQASLTQARTEVAATRAALQEYQSGTLIDQEYADTLIAEIKALDTLIGVFSSVTADGQVTPAELIQFQTAQSGYTVTDQARLKIDTRRQPESSN